MQLRFTTDLTGEEYVRCKAWETATLRCCPRHGPAVRCGFRAHGTYSRKRPAGVKVRRFYCPTAGETFSLLPDFLAKGLPEELVDVEAVVLAAERGGSQEKVASELYPELDLPSALRKLRRRVLPVRETLRVFLGLRPDLFAGLEPRVLAFQSVLGPGSVLVQLRRLAGDQVAVLPGPVGFGHRTRRRGRRGTGVQHEVGPDPPGPGG